MAASTAWDAGTEFNNELCGFIPGPPCGNPLIRDTGPGIAASELPLVFDRFHRAQKSGDSNEARGAGLGLAIAKRAVELHGGNIHCESREGEGTTFRFELPTDSPPLSAPPPPA